MESDLWREISGNATIEDLESENTQKLPLNQSLKDKTAEFHTYLINEIIKFCKENKIEADYVSLDADCLMDSIKVGKWHPGTDSSFALFDENKNVIVSSM